MRIQFTKMHGAGNDFIVIDGVRQRIVLSPIDVSRLCDRHFGIGADQLLLVERSDELGVDFRYRIFNADGSEVEQCGNGARCFVRFVHDEGLDTRSSIRVRTISGVIELHLQSDGRVTVDMGPPVFEEPRVPFDTQGLTARVESLARIWPLDLAGATVDVVAVSMGNPHAVTRVDDVSTAEVARLGALIEHHRRFSRRVNAGFMQVLSGRRIRLRVWERGAGETLACGTGACAAVVSGIARGLLEERVDVETRGGVLTIEWRGGSVFMTGPAERVFQGEIEVTDTP